MLHGATREGVTAHGAWYMLVPTSQSHLAVFRYSF
jgi:hypothetical protein